MRALYACKERARNPKIARPCNLHRHQSRWNLTLNRICNAQWSSKMAEVLCRHHGKPSRWPKDVQRLHSCSHKQINGAMSLQCRYNYHEPCCGAAHTCNIRICTAVGIALICCTELMPHGSAVAFNSILAYFCSYAAFVHHLISYSFCHGVRQEAMKRWK